jgi:hypothetical protein
MRRKSSLELFQHGGWDRMRLEPAVRIAHYPHALFGALDAGIAVQA